MCSFFFFFFSRCCSLKGWEIKREKKNWNVWKMETLIGMLAFQKCESQQRPIVFLLNSQYLPFHLTSSLGLDVRPYGYGWGWKSLYTWMELGTHGEGVKSWVLAVLKKPVIEIIDRRPSLEFRMREEPSGNQSMSVGRKKQVSQKQRARAQPGA